MHSLHKSNKNLTDILLTFTRYTSVHTITHSLYSHPKRVYIFSHNLNFKTIKQSKK